MDKQAAKKTIIALIRAEYEAAENAYRNAHAERVGTDAAANAWDEINAHRGFCGPSQNPHNTDRALEREQATKARALQMREAYSYAVDTFC